MKSRPQFYRAAIAHMLILTAALVPLSSCNRQPANPPPSQSAVKLRMWLELGNSAIKAMDQAATPRDENRYFTKYEDLRHSYINTVELLQNEPSHQADEVTLSKLREWEPVIKTARKKWQDMRHRPLGPLPADVPPQARKQIEEQAKRMEEHMSQDWETKNAQWTPFEAQLDKAIATVHELRPK